MAINFPASPVLDETYSFAGSSWKWNGYAWKLTGGAIQTSGNYVISLNGLTGGVTLAAGTGITLGTTQNVVTISATGTGGGSTITDYVWSFNGLTGTVEGVNSVNGATGDIVNVAKTNTPNTFSALQTFISGITAIGATFESVFVSKNIEVGGNINILGTLNVDGLIISKTGFSGFTLDSDLETVEGVLLDGGEF